MLPSAEMILKTKKLQVVNTKTNGPIHPQPTLYKTYGPYIVLVPFNSAFLLDLTVNNRHEKERTPRNILVAILNSTAWSGGHGSTNQTFFASQIVALIVACYSRVSSRVCRRV